MTSANYVRSTPSLRTRLTSYGVYEYSIEVYVEGGSARRTVNKMWGLLCKKEEVLRSIEFSQTEDRNLRHVLYDVGPMLSSRSSRLKTWPCIASTSQPHHQCMHQACYSINRFEKSQHKLRIT